MGVDGDAPLDARLAAAAELEAARAVDAVKGNNPVVAAQRLDIARRALVVRRMLHAADSEAGQAPESGEEAAAHREFLERLRSDFDQAGTETATRIADRIAAHLRATDPEGGVPSGNLFDRPGMAELDPADADEREAAKRVQRGNDPV